MTQHPGRYGWGRGDSNPHALRHMLLRHARLPIPPLPLGKLSPSAGSLGTRARNLRLRPADRRDARVWRHHRRLSRRARTEPEHRSGPAHPTECAARFRECRPAYSPAVTEETQPRAWRPSHSRPNWRGAGSARRSPSWCCRRTHTPSRKSGRSALRAASVSRSNCADCWTKSHASHGPIRRGGRESTFTRISSRLRLLPACAGRLSHDVDGRACPTEQGLAPDLPQ